MKDHEGAWRRRPYVETLHGCLGSPFLQRINDPLFEDTPVVEGLDPKEVDQREKFLDFVLTAAEINNLGEVGSVRDLHRGAGEAPTMVAFEGVAGLRTLGCSILDCMCFVYEVWWSAKESADKS